MINMEYYYNKITDDTTENKIRKFINRNILAFIIFSIFLLAGIIFMLFGVYKIFFKIPNGSVDYIIGFLLAIAAMLIIILLTRFNPLSKYSTNDKIFIYIFYLDKEVEKIRKLSKFNKQLELLRVHFLTILIAHELNIVNNNLNNLFIFYLPRENAALIRKIQQCISDKIVVLLHKEHFDEIQTFLNKIIQLYQYVIISEGFNDIDFSELSLDSLESSKANNQRELNELLDSIITTKNIKESVYIISIKKIFISKRFLTVITLLACTILYFIGTMNSISTNINNLITLISISITLLVIIWRKQ